MRSVDGAIAPDVATRAATRVAAGIRLALLRLRCFANNIARLTGLTIVAVLTRLRAHVLPRFRARVLALRARVLPRLRALRIALLLIAIIATRLLLIARLLVEAVDVVAVLGGSALGPLAVIVFVIVLALRTALLVEARAALAEDAKIMVRELQIIFGQYPVALHLRVAGERLVFFVELAGVAACAIVDTIAAALPILTVGARRAATTAATAAVLSIVYQVALVLVTRGRLHHSSAPGQSRSHGCIRPYGARRSAPAEPLPRSAWTASTAADIGGPRRRPSAYARSDPVP